MKIINQIKSVVVTGVAALLFMAMGSAAHAGVAISMVYPLAATPCDTLSVTSTVVNTGATLSQLQVSEILPGGTSYEYVTNSLQISVQGGATSTNQSVMTINGGTNLVFNLSNIQTTNGPANLVLSEVFPGTNTTQDWFEIFNPTANTISLNGWSIKDARPGIVDPLPNFTLAAGQFLVVAANTNNFLTGHPNFNTTNNLVQFGDNFGGNGLNIYADGLFLINSNSVTVDTLSWGFDTSAFNPSVPYPTSPTASLARVPANVDSGTAHDWVQLNTPTPGTGVIQSGLASGTSITIVYQLTAKCGGVGGYFDSTATYQQPPGSSTQTNNTVDFIAFENPVLLVSKTPQIQQATLNGLVTWQLQVINSGFGTAHNVTVYDSIHSGLQFVGFSIPPTTANPTATNSVYWDQTAIAALTGLTNGETPISITVTARVTTCEGDLGNRGDASFGCDNSALCQDTRLEADGATAAIEYFGTRPYLNFSVTPANPIAVPYCSGIDITLSVTNNAEPYGADAYNIGVSPYLVPGYTLSQIGGGSVTNADELILSSVLAQGTGTNITLHLQPGGVCPLNTNLVAQLMEPGYSDICGMSYAAPIIPVMTWLNGLSAAAVTESFNPWAIHANTTTNVTVMVDLVYTNMGSGSIPQTLYSQYPTNGGWGTPTSISAGGVLHANTNTITWTTNVSGSGEAVFTYQISVTKGQNCTTNRSYFPLTPAVYHDCESCPQTVDTNSLWDIEIPTYDCTCTNCGGNGTNCTFEAGINNPIPLVETCQSQPFTMVITNLAGHYPNQWTNVVWSASLTGGSYYYESSAVTVLANGVNVTTNMAVTLVGGLLQIDFDGLNTNSTFKNVSSVTNLQVSWDGAIGQTGAVSQDVQFNLCSASDLQSDWVVGTSAMQITLTPPFVGFECGKITVPIGLQQVASPFSLTSTNGIFPDYNVDVVLNLDPLGDPTASGNGTNSVSLSYVTNSTVLVNIVSNAVGRPLILTNEPTLTNNLLIWHLGNLGLFTNGTLNCQFQMQCGGAPIQQIQAVLRYNNLCQQGSTPQLNTSETPEQLVSDQASSLSESVSPGLVTMSTTNFNFQAQFFNAGAAPAHNFFIEVQVPTNIVLTSATVPWNYVTALNNGTNAYYWNFTNNTAPLQGLVDDLGDGSFNDLAYEGSFILSVTGAVISCGNQEINTLAGSGCLGRQCEQAGPLPVDLELLSGTAVAMLVFPTALPVCETNALYYDVRNASLASIYQVTPYFYLPSGLTYVAGSAVATNKLTGQHISIPDPSGSGTVGDPYTWSSTNVAYLAELVSANDVIIGFKVNVACDSTVQGEGGAYATYILPCVGLTNTATELSAGNVGVPVLSLTKQFFDLNNHPKTESTAGETNIFYLTIQPTAQSAASAQEMLLTDYFPTNSFAFMGASIKPDSTNGGILVWSNNAMMTHIPNQATGPYAITSAPISLVVTTLTLADCSSPAINTAEVDYGCSNSLCQSTTGSASVIMTPELQFNSPGETLQLDSCGGTYTTTLTNYGAPADGIIWTNYAPSGYLIAAATVSGALNSPNGQSATLTLGGTAPYVGQYAILNLSNTNLTNVRGTTNYNQGAGDIYLGPGQGFTVTFTLVPESAVLDCLLNDYPPSPVPVTATNAVTFDSFCGSPAEVNDTFTTLPAQPKPTVTITPGSIIVTNGQVQNFVVTLGNISTYGVASNLEARVLFQAGWTNITILGWTNNASGVTNGFVIQTNAQNAVLVDLGGVTIAPLETVTFGVQATAVTNNQSLAIKSEVVGQCGVSSPDACSTFSPSNPLALTIPPSPNIATVTNDTLYGFYQDDSDGVGFTLNKTVRYSSELAATAGSFRVARIGEPLVYELTATFFDAPFTNIVVSDPLPANVVAGIPVDAGSSTNLTNWVYNATAGTFTWVNNLTNDGVFVVDIPVTNADSLINQQGVVYTNTVTTAFDTVVTNQPAPVSAVVADVEPTLGVTTLVSTTDSGFSTSVGNIQASNTLYYEIVITNLVSSTNAYNLWLSNSVPPGFFNPTVVSVNAIGNILTNGVLGAGALNNGLLNFTGGSLNLGTNAVELDTNSTLTIVFTAQPGYSMEPNESMPDQTTIQWTSMSGSVPQERTGVTLIPSPGTNDALPVTGASSPVNNYADTSAAAVGTIQNASIAKVLVGTSQTDPGNNNTNLTIGELARYTLTLTVPQGTTTNATIVDYLPNGLAFVEVTNVSWSAGVSNSLPITPLVVTQANITVLNNGNQVTFNLGNVTNINNNNSAASLAITFNVVALDSTPTITNRYGASITNTATFTSGTATATVVSAPVTIVEPQLSVTEVVSTNSGGVFTSSVGTVQANDMVYYEITITNSANAGGSFTNTTAYDLWLSNSLPANLVNPSLISLTEVGGGVLTNSVSGTGTLNNSLINLSGNLLTLAPANEIDLPPGSSLVLLVSGTVNPTMTPGTSFTDTNTIIWASLPGSQTDLSTYDASESNERTGFGGTMPRANRSNFTSKTIQDNYAAAAAATVTTINPGFAKVLIGTDHSSTGNGTNDAVIGELVSYQLTVTVPQGVTPNATIVDTLPTNLAFVSITNVSWTLNVSNSQPITVGTTQANLSVANNGNQVTFNLGNITNLNNNDAADMGLSIIFQAVTLDVLTNQAGTNFVNSATFNSGSFNSTINSAAVTVVEPTLQVNELVSSSPTSGFGASQSGLQGGDTVYYQLTITNSAGLNSATAYDLWLSNSLPAGLINPTIVSITNAGPGDVYTNGLTATNGLSTGLFTFNGTVLNVSSGNEIDLDTNGAIVLVISAQLSPTINPLENLTNNTDIQWASLPGSQTGLSSYISSGDNERTGGSANFSGVYYATNFSANNTLLDNYAAVSPAVVSGVASPAISKVLIGTDHSAPGNANNDAVIGEHVTYQLTVTVPQGVTTNATIVDALPTNLAFVSVTGVSWSLNVTNSQPISVATTQANLSVLNDGNQLTFNLGNVTNLNSDDATTNGLTITFQTVVLDVLTNQAGTNFVNTATFKMGTLPIGTNTTAAVTVVEPTLQITEQISSNPTNGFGASLPNVDAGDTVYYELTITNSAGLAGTTAYDLWLSNSLPAGLINPTVYSVTNLGTGDVYTNGQTGTNGLSTSLFSITGNLLTVAGTNEIDLDTNGAIVLIVSAQLGGTVTPGASLPDNSTIEWASLPGTQTNLSSYNSASNERTGVTPPLPAPGVNNSTNNTLLDNYAAASGVTIATVPAPVLSKGIVAADEPGVTGNSGVTGTNATIGELVTYRITVGLPEGTTTNLVVTDQLPAGLAYVTNSLAIESSRPADANANIPGTGTEAFGGSVSLPTVTPSAVTNGPIVFTFGTITVNSDNDTNNNVFSFTYQAVVLDIATNSGLAYAQTDWTNTFTWVGGQNSTTPGLTDASGNVVAVVEPNLNLSQTLLVDGNPGQTCAYLGSPVVYNLVIKPATNSLSTAFNVGFSDQIPLPINVTGLIITNSEGVDLSSYFTLVSGLLSTTNGSTLSLATNDYINIIVSGVVTPGPVGGYTNTASLTYSSRNGDYTTNSGFNPNPFLTTDQERLYAASDSTALTLNVDSIGGYVYADANDDGIKQGGESGLSGVTVSLVGTNVLDQVINLSTNTAGDGSYLFGDLLPGSYILTRTTTPASYVDGKETAGTPYGGSVNNTSTNSTSINNITISSCVSDAGVNYNFGLIQPDSVSGLVFADLDRNGQYNGVDYPITNVVITLTGTNDLGVSITNVLDTLTDGTYDFTGLRPGTYALTETQPAGYGQGTNALGSAGGTNSAQDVFSNIVLSQNQNGINYNYGEVVSSSISGYVYADANNNGIYEGGETPLSGVTVTLTGTNIEGQVITLSTNTASNGSYDFGNLLPGNYVLDRTTTPAGYIDGKQTAGTPFGGSVDNATGCTYITDINIPIGGSYSGVNYDFGLVKPASVSGLVFADLNLNGLDDGSDYPITNVVITLTGTNDEGNSITNVLNTLTDGTYDFTGLRPGTYTLSETQPAGYGQGTNALGTAGGTNSAQDVFSDIVLGQNQNGLHYNYGETLGNSTIAGYVYADANNDGTYQNSETPLSGVTVTLVGTNLLGDVITLSTNTASDGSYFFGGLLPGNYVLDRTTTPAGYLDGKETAGTPYGGTVNNATNSTLITGISIPTGGDYTGVNYNFGLILPNSLSGLVFADLNRNGVYDGTDYPITNVTVTLTGTDDRGNPVDEVFETLTNGTYDFTGLRGGTYTLTETQPTGYGQGTNALGSMGGTNPTQDVFSTIVLDQNQNGINYNYGETLGAIGNYVWNDANDDGIRQPAEQGIPGVLVFLDLNHNGIYTNTEPSCVTDAQGYYLITNLLGGSYTVCVATNTLPAGAIETYSLVGGTASPHESVTVTLTSGATRLDCNFGYRYISPTQAALQAGSFQGSVTNGGIALTWTTLSEVDSEYYFVNRLSTDGQYDDQVGFAFSANSPDGAVYGAVDTTATAPGTYQYQLVEQDIYGDANVLGNCSVVIAPIVLTINAQGGNVVLHWTGGTSPYHLYQSTALGSTGSVAHVVGGTVPGWTEVPLSDSSTNSAVVPVSGPAGYFRVSSGQ